VICQLCVGVSEMELFMNELVAWDSAK